MAAMTYWLVVSVLVVSLNMHTTLCGKIDKQACENNVQRECQCNIGFDDSGDENGNEKLCKKLQSCADCMAVPRCSSVSLDQFRGLLRWTIIISKTKKICPDINYEGLVQGMKKDCQGNGDVYNRCGDKCSCEAGIYSACSRVRKEFTQMSIAERRRFVNAYYKATTDPFLKDDFMKILNVHSQVPTELLHHMPQIFFPWHRWFLLKAENFLRQIDCRVTIPYFQWTAAGKNIWRTTNPKDVWSGGPQGLGGNGVPPSYCVKNGKFREGNWHLPVSEGGGCLKRKFDKTCKLFTERKLHKLLRSKSFKKFEKIVREELHSTFHDCIGGDMPDNTKSAYTPEVLLHHAFIDKIWDRWQRRNDSNKYIYYTSINFRMPFADLYPWQVLDNNDLPGGVVVVYQKFKTRARKKGKVIKL